MINHLDITDRDLRTKIKQKQICFAGNKKLKTYSTLTCTSGKRMKRKNRILFESKHEALENGFRPCGHCMRMDYIKYRKELLSS
jgi:methylphosphotriester-DNA--protein-cysteine methyltransferase